MVFVSDMARSARFYRDTIGLLLKFESPEWTEFITGGATLALHKADHSGNSQSSQNVEAAGHCRPGFAVENLDAFHSRMVDSEVSCIQVPQNVFGVRITQYLDPDGLVISVSESGKRT